MNPTLPFHRITRPPPGGNGPLVVLSHALGCDTTMWDGVADALHEHCTVLRYDHRGHGRTPASPGPFTIDDLADDAAALIRAQRASPVHFVGLSMGGMTAQALAARHPSLVRSLVVANAASHYDAPARAVWQSRIDTVRSQGMSAIADGAMQRWFTPAFRDDAAVGRGRVAAMRAVLESTAPEPYVAACEAVSAIDLAAANEGIACPTLVIAGQHDEATPPAMSVAIAVQIPRARLTHIDAAHLSAVEQPEAFAQLLLDFWGGLDAA